jgi:hypothetical protein
VPEPNADDTQTLTDHPRQQQTQNAHFCLICAVFSFTHLCHLTTRPFAKQRCTTLLTGSVFSSSLACLAFTALALACHHHGHANPGMQALLNSLRLLGKSEPGGAPFSRLHHMWSWIENQERGSQRSKILPTIATSADRFNCLSFNCLTPVGLVHWCRSAPATQVQAALLL